MSDVGVREEGQDLAETARDRAAPAAGERTARRLSGPRGEHDRAGFAALVAAAAEAIVRDEGARALGMRRLAAAVGYAPNSIYNAVGDLDQVVLRVNARSLDRLRATLDAALDPGASPQDNAAALASAYLGFVRADPAVWSLVYGYAFAPGCPVPDWHGQALARAVAPVEATLAPLVPDPAERARLVAALWAALHGLAALATSGKLAGLTADRPEELARLLVTRVLSTS